jgi:hypothetical protein
MFDPKGANSISYLGTGFLKAIEASETESRLDAIERALRRLDRQQLDAAQRDIHFLGLRVVLNFIVSPI